MNKQVYILLLVKDTDLLSYILVLGMLSCHDLIGVQRNEYRRTRLPYGKEWYNIHGGLEPLLPERSIILQCCAEGTQTPIFNSRMDKMTQFYVQFERKSI